MNKNMMSFPVEPQDAFNYLVGKYSANNQLSYIMRINGRVNETILKKAMYLSVDEQPILGCRLMENDDVATWERRGDLDEIEMCTVVETHDVEGELQKFIAQCYDAEHDCQVKLKIFRGEFDTVCLKVNHACCDAGGFKEYLHTLANIYNHIFNEQLYVLEPCSPNSRSQSSIFQLPEIITKINTMVGEEDNQGHTVGFPFVAGENTKQTLVIRNINQQEFNAIKMHARRNGATINDVYLTAYSRALSNIAELENEIISVCFTADLRKYMPKDKNRAMCNLSGMNSIHINRNLAESFGETLSKVVSKTKNIKDDFPGINMALYFETLANLKFKEVRNQIRKFCEESAKTKFCNPWISNVGILSDSRITLGRTEVEECYMIGTASYAPGLMMLVSTYDNTSTLSINFFQSTMEKKNVEELMDSVFTDIKSWVKI
ncbi:hypothetical protein [Pelosinus propionicus]|uniref:Uncharacterized protein, contains a NRPS condensation (Elongation) domain n=1 Tax=Pelosinus propionicus DSM 13327 TaxID=1123291 RepID=A0A1I4PX35_9FIRM|nr:hypothetical protein [Pelosinus propionicus]SFM32020.1 Uncharacterized protein, contains a NRPS condensation (elongation) domain [Pelosinus propionicus DSM 13327]